MSRPGFLNHFASVPPPQIWDSKRCIFWCQQDTTCSLIHVAYLGVPWHDVHTDVTCFSSVAPWNIKGSYGFQLRTSGLDISLVWMFSVFQMQKIKLFVCFFLASEPMDVDGKGKGYIRTELISVSEVWVCQEEKRVHFESTGVSPLALPISHCDRIEAFFPSLPKQTFNVASGNHHSRTVVLVYACTDSGT